MSHCHRGPLPSLGGHGPGYSGVLPNTNPHSFQFHSAFFSLRKSLLLSHPTSPAAIEDFLTPVQVVPGLGPLPPQASRHTPRASGKLPSSWSIPGREALPGSLPPSLHACLSHLILHRPPLHWEEEHGGIVPQDGALPWGLAPCPGGGPGTKLSKGGAGCPLMPSQPPWACLDATLPSPRWDWGQWPPDHHHHHHDATARFCSQRTLPRPV